MESIAIVPTYNEKGTIRELIQAISKFNLDILVVDDNSPDRTWKIVEETAKKNKKLHLLLRKGERGRGLAGIAGFKYALQRNYKYIIEMDGDFSHDPACIPLFLKKIKSCDMVIGSRLIKGGRQIGRSLIRRLITRLANLYIRSVLGLKVKDCSSGYRCFRRDVLKSINLNRIKSKGPDIVQETLYRCHLKNFRICEIPIVFKERKEGKSKLKLKHIFRSYIRMISLRFSK